MAGTKVSALYSPTVEERLERGRRHNGRRRPGGPKRADDDPASVELVFEDEGIPFDPVTDVKSAPSTTVRERAIDGLGIHMVQETGGLMTYERTGRTNRLKVRITRTT